MTNLARRPPTGQKSQNLREPAARKNAQGKPCTLRLHGCRHDPAYTVFAHFREFNCAGMGEKGPDFFGAFACDLCHHALDLRDLHGAESVTYEDMLRAMLETLQIQFKDGIFIKRSDVGAYAP